jgi:hypothetical protein
VDRAAVVVVEAHGAVPVVGVDRTLRALDRQALVVDPQPVPVRVGVGEDPELEHLVRRVPDARHDVGGGEGRLLDVGEVVLGGPVELEDAPRSPATVEIPADVVRGGLSGICSSCP